MIAEYTYHQACGDKNIFAHILSMIALPRITPSPQEMYPGIFGEEDNPGYQTPKKLDAAPL